MRIDLNCPAEAVETELIRGEESWIRIILMNLSDRGIDSCEATVRLMDRAGKEVGRTVHRARALKGRPHSTFPMMIPLEIPETAFSAEATLDKVWMEDHDVWRRDPAREREYEPNLLPPGNELNALRYVAGSGAVGFPSQQPEIWVCVCGRPNSNGESICARCRRQREMIFQQYSRNAVMRQVSQRERQLDLETRGAREETARLQRLREEEYERKQLQTRRRKGLTAALLCAVLLAGVIYFGVEPGLRLWSGINALQESRLEEARTIFSSLGAFPGAAQRLEAAELLLARLDGETATEDRTAISLERMTAVAKTLRTSADAADSALAERVDLARAERLITENDLDGAETLLDVLPSSAEKEGVERKAVFARGEQAMEARQFAEARRLFLSLGEEPGAAEKAREAIYQLALAWMAEGDYDAAISALAEMPEDTEGTKLALQCWYLKGVALEREGRTEEARQAYLAAGTYENAAERAQILRWQQAENAYAAKDYATAWPIYREMDGYADAREKWLLCATELARAAYKQREYALAASYLEDLPEDTREIRQIRTRGFYLGAKAAANRGNLEEALALIEKVPDYSDARKLIRNWRLTLAQEKLEAGLYEEALAILDPLEEGDQANRLRKEIEAAMTTADQGENTQEQETP